MAQGWKVGGCGKPFNVRVGTGIGHGKEEWLGVCLLEVLIGKLLAVDGLAPSALSIDDVSASVE